MFHTGTWILERCFACRRVESETSHFQQHWQMSLEGSLCWTGFFFSFIFFFSLFLPFVQTSRFQRCPVISWQSLEPQSSTELGWRTGGQSQCHCQAWLSHFTLCHHSYHNFTPSFTLSWLVTPLWNTSAPWRIYLWFLIIPFSAYLSQMPPPSLFVALPFSLLLLHLSVVFALLYLSLRSWKYTLEVNNVELKQMYVSVGPL